VSAEWSGNGAERAENGLSGSGAWSEWHNKKLSYRWQTARSVYSSVKSRKLSVL